jgi:predicted alpha/beta-fold hydrolase
MTAVLNTTPAETTQYSVAMTDAQGCTADVDWLVTVNPLPAVPTIVLFGGELLSSAPSGNQWYYAGVPLPNQTNQNFVPIQNGEYTVVVTNTNGCSASSLPFMYNGVGVDEAAARMFKVYPNPFEDEMVVEGANPGAVVMVYALGGQVVHESRIENNVQRIALTNLRQGVYYLEINYLGIIYRAKLVKQ